MQYEHDDEDFEQTGGGKWIRLLGMVAYTLVILAFAWQTLELVSWLFPDENWFMKAVTVFVCDGCATLYAMAEMFYRFRLRWSKNLIFGMWIVAFLFSTSATIVQMYLSSINRIPHQIDTGVTTIAYAIIIFAFVVNIIAITSVIRMEYNAGQPKRVYQDDKEYRHRRSPQRVRVVESARVTPALAAPAIAASKNQVLDPQQVKPAIDSEKKSIEKKPSLADRIWAVRDKIDAKLDSKQTQKIETAPEESPVEETPIEDDLPENYLDWTDKQWKKAKELLSKEQYNELFDEVFPPEGLKPTPKKGKGGKQTKNVTQMVDQDA